MANRWALRFGGLSGILFVALLIPGSLIGRPDVPEPGVSAQEVHSYFNDWRDLFIAGNGLTFIFAAFFFLWFLVHHQERFWAMSCSAAYEVAERSSKIFRHNVQEASRSIAQKVR